MYSSDRMKTLIRLFKDYDKNIVFRNCQMHYFKYLFEKKCTEILLNFLPKSNRYWTTFETLTEIERDCKERQLCVRD